MTRIVLAASLPLLVGLYVRGFCYAMDIPWDHASQMAASMAAFFSLAFAVPIIGSRWL